MRGFFTANKHIAFACNNKPAVLCKIYKIPERVWLHLNAQAEDKEKEERNKNNIRE